MKTIARRDAAPSLLTALADCVWEADLDADGDWQFRFISDGVEEITGYPAEWLIQDFRRWSEIVHPEDFSATQARFDEFLASELGLLVQEYRIMHADGRERWLHVRTAAERDGAGAVVRLAGAITDVSKRKIPEVRVQHNEHLLSQMLEGVADGILFIDRKRYVMFANAGAERVFGVPRQELVGRSWSQRRWKATLPDGQPVPAEQHGDKVAIESGKPSFGLERLITRADGTQIHVSCNVVPLWDDDGRIVGAVVTYEDITARVKAETELRRREHHFRTLVERSTDAIALIDASATIQYATPSSEQVLGYPNNEFVGINGFSLVHPDDLDSVRGDFEKAVEDATVVVRRTVRVRAKDGRYRYIEAVLSNHLADPGIQAMVVNFRDVTDREQAAMALRASEERFRALFERNLAGVFRTRTDGTIIECNDACARVFGFDSAKELIGKSSSDFYPSPEDRKRLIQRIVKHGSLNSVEVQMCRHDRTPVWVLENVTFRQEIDAPALFEGTLIDITDRKRAEEQLQQSRKLEALGQLAGGVAHDFNNLLTVILGNLSLAQEALPAGHNIRSFLHETEKAASRAAELTSQLLGFARRRAVHLRPVAPARIIDEVSNLLRRTIDPRIHLDVVTPPSLWTVEADTGQLHSVLLNLCLNARDAMPDGGRLRIEADNVFVDEQHAAWHNGARTGEFVRLRVADSGCGMPPDVRRRIFEPFFTTKAPGKGTGLGLAMTFGVVQQHRGWIECDSVPGKGTRFDIYLPRSSQAPQESLDGVSLPNRGRETILLVDDEEMVRTVAATVLSTYGYAIIQAENGAKAVEIFRERNGEIDLVVLDMVMPQLSGRETFLLLQEIDSNVRVILSSGYANESLSIDEKAGICGCVCKPYRARDLAAAVRAALDGKTDVGMNL